MHNKKQRQNLISPQMIAGHIKDMCWIKIAIILLASALLVGAYVYGSKAITEKLNYKATEIEANSAFNQAEELQKQIAVLNEDIQNVEASIDSNTTYLEHMNTEEVSQARIQDFVQYVVEHKPNNITLILLEDKCTTESYAGTGGSQPEDPVGAAEGTEGTGTDQTNQTTKTTTEQNKEDTERLGYSSDVLKYAENIEGKELVIRGFAVDRATLSNFLVTIGKFEGIVAYQITAIEDMKVDDYSINLFDITVTI